MLWTQNLLVNVRDPVSRIFMKTNKISLLRNITLEDFIALSKWLQKSGKCNISYLLEQQVFHNLEQLSLSNISKNNFYTAKVYYGVKVCRRNTLVGHPPSVSVRVSPVWPPLVSWTLTTDIGCWVWADQRTPASGAGLALPTSSPNLWCSHYHLICQHLMSTQSWNSLNIFTKRSLNDNNIRYFLFQ